MTDDKKRRMVPPLDEIYGLIDSPFPKETIDLLFGGDQITFERLADEHAMLKEDGDGYRLITVSTLKTIAAGIERAIDETNQQTALLAKVVEDPQGFADNVEAMNRVVEQAMGRTPPGAES